MVEESLKGFDMYEIREGVKRDEFFGRKGACELIDFGAGLEFLESDFEGFDLGGKS
jgi:hypothetical protein